MIFGVHNYYNNNSSSIGKFQHPFGFDLFATPVRVTNQGIVIFNLDSTAKVETKISMAIRLNQQLCARYKKGLSFASCGFSDCVDEYELAPFFKGMKERFPDIITIYADSSCIAPMKAYLKSIKVDHIVGIWGDTAQEVVSILQPTPEDRQEPREGWRKFENQLTELFI